MTATPPLRKPTGKLAFAEQIIASLEQARADLEAEVARLRAQMQTIKDYAGNPEIVWKTAVAALGSKP